MGHALLSSRGGDVMFNAYFSCGADLSEPYFDSVYDVYAGLCGGEVCGPNRAAAYDMYRYLIGKGM